MDKWALVLGGGAARGLAHIGVIRALEERGFRPSLVVGCSMGALVGAFYALGTPPRAMEGFVRHLLGTPKKAKAFLPVRPSAQGLLDPSRVEELLENFLGGVQFEELELPLAVVATDIVRKEEVVFTSGGVAPAVRASISIPGLFPPVKFAKRILVDGGVLDPVPVKVARKLGAERLVVVNVVRDAARRIVQAEAPAELRRESHPLLAEIISTLTHRDWSVFKVVEESVWAVQAALAAEALEEGGDVVIDVKLKGVDYMDFHKVREAIEEGYRTAREVLQGLNSKTFPLPEGT